MNEGGRRGGNEKRIMEELYEAGKRGGMRVEEKGGGGGVVVRIWRKCRRTGCCCI